MNKEDYRIQFKSKRDSLKTRDLDSLNQNIFSNFIGSDLYKTSKNIMSFVSFGSEVDSHRLIKKALEDGKNIFIPFIKEGEGEMRISRLRSFNDLQPGRFNILETKKELIEEAPIDVLDLIIVPGLVFDKKGYRIGYGGGYYDKFMATSEKNIKKLGISFNFQLINDKLPKDDFDIAVNYILTEEGIINVED